MSEQIKFGISGVDEVRNAIEDILKEHKNLADSFKTLAQFAKGASAPIRDAAESLEDFNARQKLFVGMAETTAKALSKMDDEFFALAQDGVDVAEVYGDLANENRKLISGLQASAAAVRESGDSMAQAEGDAKALVVAVGKVASAEVAAKDKVLAADQAVTKAKDEKKHAVIEQAKAVESSSKKEVQAVRAAYDAMDEPPDFGDYIPDYFEGITDAADSAAAAVNGYSAALTQEQKLEAVTAGRSKKHNVAGIERLRESPQLLTPEASSVGGTDVDAMRKIAEQDEINAASVAHLKKGENVVTVQMVQWIAAREVLAQDVRDRIQALTTAGRKIELEEKRYIDWQEERVMAMKEYALRLGAVQTDVARISELEAKGGVEAQERRVTSRGDVEARAGMLEGDASYKEELAAKARLAQEEKQIADFASEHVRLQQLATLEGKQLAAVRGEVREIESSISEEFFNRARLAHIETAEGESQVQLEAQLAETKGLISDLTKQDVRFQQLATDKGQQRLSQAGELAQEERLISENAAQRVRLSQAETELGQTFLADRGKLQAIESNISQEAHDQHQLAIAETESRQRQLALSAEVKQTERLTAESTELRVKGEQALTQKGHEVLALRGQIGALEENAVKTAHDQYQLDVLDTDEKQKQLRLEAELKQRSSLITDETAKQIQLEQLKSGSRDKVLKTTAEVVQRERLITDLTTEQVKLSQSTTSEFTRTAALRGKNQAIEQNLVGYARDKHQLSVVETEERQKQLAVAAELAAKERLQTNLVDQQVRLEQVATSQGKQSLQQAGKLQAVEGNLTQEAHDRLQLDVLATRERQDQLRLTGEVQHRESMISNTRRAEVQIMDLQNEQTREQIVLQAEAARRVRLAGMNFTEKSSYYSGMFSMMTGVWSAVEMGIASATAAVTFFWNAWTQGAQKADLEATARNFEGLGKIKGFGANVAIQGREKGIGDSEMAQLALLADKIASKKVALEGADRKEAKTAAMQGLMDQLRTTGELGDAYKDLGIKQSTFDLALRKEAQLRGIMPSDIDAVTVGEIRLNMIRRDGVNAMGAYITTSQDAQQQHLKDLESFGNAFKGIIASATVKVGGEDAVRSAASRSDAEIRRLSTRTAGVDQGGGRVDPLTGITQKGAGGAWLDLETFEALLDERNRALEQIAQLDAARAATATEAVIGEVSRMAEQQAIRGDQDALMRLGDYREALMSAQTELFGIKKDMTDRDRMELEWTRASLVERLASTKMLSAEQAKQLLSITDKAAVSKAINDLEASQYDIAKKAAQVKLNALQFQKSSNQFLSTAKKLTIETQIAEQSRMLTALEMNATYSEAVSSLDSEQAKRQAMLDNEKIKTDVLLQQELTLTSHDKLHGEALKKAIEVHRYANQTAESELERLGIIAKAHVIETIRQKEGEKYDERVANMNEAQRRIEDLRIKGLSAMLVIRQKLGLAAGLELDASRELYEVGKKDEDKKKGKGGAKAKPELDYYRDLVKAQIDARQDFSNMQSYLASSKGSDKNTFKVAQETDAKAIALSAEFDIRAQRAFSNAKFVLDKTAAHALADLEFWRQDQIKLINQFKGKERAEKETAMVELYGLRAESLVKDAIAREASRSDSVAAMLKKSGEELTALQKTMADNRKRILAEVEDMAFETSLEKERVNREFVWNVFGDKGGERGLTDAEKDISRRQRALLKERDMKLAELSITGEAYQTVLEYYAEKELQLETELQQEKSRIRAEAAGGFGSAAIEKKNMETLTSSYKSSFAAFGGTLEEFTLFTDALQQKGQESAEFNAERMKEQYEQMGLEVESVTFKMFTESEQAFVDNMQNVMYGVDVFGQAISEWEKTSIRLAEGNYTDLQKISSYAGVAIAASSVLADRLIKDDKAKAYVKGTLEVAHSVASFAAGEPVGGAGHAAAAALYFFAAGKGKASVKTKKKEANQQTELSADANVRFRDRGPREVINIFVNPITGESVVGLQNSLATRNRGIQLDGRLISSQPRRMEL